MGDYNGWTNRATWNVALWLGNDEELYRIAQKSQSYEELVDTLRGLDITHTPDGVAYASPYVSHRELDEMLKEL